MRQDRLRDQSRNVAYNPADNSTEADQPVLPVTVACASRS